METSHGWFDVSRIGPGVTAIGEPGHVEQVHSYLIEGETDVAVLDTGMGVGDFHGLVTSLTGRRPIVLQSHAHWDHVGDSARFERVLIHPSEANDLQKTHTSDELASWFAEDQLLGLPFPDGFDPTAFEIRGTTATGFLHHGDRIDLGERTLEVFHTPGHSPGGITIFDPKSRLLFPGDALNLGPLYLFSGQADLRAFNASLDLLVDLAAASSALYPSHYGVPMMPDDVVATRQAFDAIIAGQEPDGLRGGVEVYSFDRFSFLIREGALEELR